MNLSVKAQTSVYSVHEGDSTTFGDGVNGSNYVFFLKEMAVGNSFPLAFTNIATGGDTISNNVSATDTLTRLTNAPFNSRLIATVYLGLNDISALYPSTNIATNLLLWTLNVRTSFPATKILMATIWPRIGDSALKDGIRTNLNSWIRDAAPVDAVLDFATNSALNPQITPGNFVDNVHPNVNGHRIIASNVWDAMQVRGYFDVPPARALNFQTLIIR